MRENGRKDALPSRLGARDTLLENFPNGMPKFELGTQCGKETGRYFSTLEREA